ncbi:hypothetical protein B8W99_20385 [Peribacillus simplex]|nr:hypothetical protein B8W99_20385 [Peribacillus simplex]
MAPPTPDTVTATHAIQPNFIIIESAYIFKNNRNANFDIRFMLSISAEDNGDSILCGVISPLLMLNGEAPVNGSAYEVFFKKT